MYMIYRAYVSILNEYYIMKGHISNITTVLNYIMKSQTLFSQKIYNIENAFDESCMTYKGIFQAMLDEIKKIKKE